MTATNDHEPAWFSEWSLNTSSRRKSTSRSYKPRQGPVSKSQGWICTITCILYFVSWEIKIHELRYKKTLTSKSPLLRSVLFLLWKIQRSHPLLKRNASIGQNGPTQEAPEQSQWERCIPGGRIPKPGPTTRRRYTYFFSFNMLSGSLKICNFSCTFYFVVIKPEVVV